jgi:SAM-dependent methyltransferase
MLKRLAKVGWKAEGIEWDESAADLARQRTGASVWAGDFRKIDIPHGRYKLIFLSHVFEHLYDPLDALKRFSELLDANGRLYMLFPNAHGLDAKWFGEYWFPLDPPRHLTFPSKKSVETCVQEAGFARSVITTNTGRWVWQNSKAYVQGGHPESMVPALSITESIGWQYQRICNSLGFLSGSEMSVALLKN